MLLTIAIPTYNRNEILFRTIQSIFPQLSSDCGLLIIDNFSDVAVEQTLQPLLTEHKDKQIRIIRNRANIGGNANIIRCIELAESDYVWILGDDDTALSNAVQIIFDKINLRPDFISFFVPIKFINVRNNDVIGDGIESLIDSIDSLGNLLFISNTVINRVSACRGLRYGYHYAGSTGPHLALMLWIATQGGHWILSSQSIVERCVADAEQRFSILPVVRGLPSLAWVLDFKYRPKFRKTLLSATLHWLTHRSVAAHLVLAEPSNPDWFSFQLVREYNIIRRLWHVGFNFSLSNLWWILWSLPLLSPRLALFGLRFVSSKRDIPIQKTNMDREI